ncbi:MAG: LysR family transcriptional regulator [Rhodospirillales bacterium]|nr:LysR family transcriptional regulator [Rhodospirillales bacterium]
MEAFYWVVRLGSVQEAARQLNVAQPTISLRIRDLETAIGTKVFQRVGRTLRANHTGEALLVHTRGILNEVSRIRERLGSDGEISGVLRVGAAETFALVCLPSLLKILRELHPLLRIELSVSASFELEEEIRNHRLDLAFLVDPLNSPGLRLIPLGVQKSTWAASPDWGLGPVIRPADIRHLPILTNAFPSAINGRIIDWFRTDGVEPTNIDVCTSVMVIVHLVAAGVAIGVLPEKLIEAQHAEGRICHLESRPAMGEAKVFAVYRRDDTSPAVDAVMRATYQVLSEINLLRPL